MIHMIILLQKSTIQSARAAVVVAAMLILSMLQTGCMPSLESSEPPVRIYWLDTTEIKDPAPVRVRIKVVPGLDSDHIWILQGDQRLNYYAGAFWADRLQPLLDSVLTRSLGDAVADAPELQATIERFFALESDDGIPEVELRARITTRELTSCQFTAREQARSERLADIVAAHQLLLDRLARELNRLATGSC